MSGGQTEVHRDTEPLATGTHAGATGSAFLRVKRADFKSCGVRVGLAIYNATQGTNGLVTAVTEDEVTDDTNSWDYGDTYEIYVTGVKGSRISSVWVDVSRGWKTDKDELIDGWRKGDIDLDDRGRKKVFGPGQPEK